MDNSAKIKPLGFDMAAQLYTREADLSPEAASNLTKMVRDVARQYDYSDSAALNTLRSRLRVAAGRKKTRHWAQEVLAATSARRTRIGALA